MAFFGNVLIQGSLHPEEKKEKKEQKYPDSDEGISCPRKKRKRFAKGLQEAQMEHRAACWRSPLAGESKNHCANSKGYRTSCDEEKEYSSQSKRFRERKKWVPVL